MGHRLEIVAGIPPDTGMTLGGRRRKRMHHSAIGEALEAGRGRGVPVVGAAVELLLCPLAALAGWIVSRDDLDGY